MTKHKWKLDSVYLEIVLNLTLDRCTVVPWAPKSFWTHALELLDDVGHVESCFDPFGDSVSVGAR